MTDDAVPEWDEEDQATYDQAVMRLGRTVIYHWWMRDWGYGETGFATLEDALAEARHDATHRSAYWDALWVSDGTQHRGTALLSLPGKRDAPRR